MKIFIYIFKIIIAGDSGVGKTTLVRRYVNNRFIPAKRATVGVDYFIKNVVITHPGIKSEIALQIWDLAGEEKYSTILPIYLPGTHGIILVYSDDVKNSLLYITEFLKILPNQNKIPMILIKAKSDLSSNQQEPEIVKNILEKQQITNYFITSAKTGQNIEEMFQKISELILRANKLI